MKMSEKKSQIAMESLMVYGAAILVVMLAIGALIHFGVFDMGSMLPDKCEFKGVNIECPVYDVAGSGVVQIELKNGMGKNIVVSSIQITGEDDMEGMWTNSDKPCKSSKSVTIVNGDISDVIEIDNCAIEIPSGKKIRGSIEMKYKFVGSDIEKTAYGEMQVVVS